jgi:hypothetical protein
MTLSQRAFKKSLSGETVFRSLALVQALRMLGGYAPKPTRLRRRIPLFQKKNGGRNNDEKNNFFTDRMRDDVQHLHRLRAKPHGR